MMSVNDVYYQLQSTTGAHERIFVHVGVPDHKQGGWIIQPRRDPDYGFQIPMLRKFFINPRQAKQRLQDIKAEGWEEFTPQEAPAAVRKFTPPVDLDQPEAQASIRRAKKR